MRPLEFPGRFLDIFGQGGPVKRAGGGQIMKRSPLTDLIGGMMHRGETERARRLEKAADLVPGIDRLYSPSALREASGSGQMGVYQPREYRNVAYPLFPYSKEADRGHATNIAKLRAMVERGEPFSDVPMLGHVTIKEMLPNYQLTAEPRQKSLFPDIDPRTQRIYLHEGRHRNYAMDQAGVEKALVHLRPYDFPLRRMDTLVPQGATGRNFSPESIYVKPRPASEFLLEEPFKRGGPVRAAGGGLMQKLRGLPLARRFDELTRHPLQDTTGKNSTFMEMASEASPLKYIGGMPDMGRGGRGGMGLGFRDPARRSFMSYDSGRYGPDQKSAQTVGKNVVLLDNKVGLPKALIDIEIEKALRGEGYGRETIATLLSRLEDEKAQFPLYDVQTKAKKIWEAMGAQPVNPKAPFRAKEKAVFDPESGMRDYKASLPRNNDYYITPEDFLSSFKRGGSVKMAGGGLSQIARMLRAEKIGRPDAKRLERAFDQVPGLENRFTDDALWNVIGNQNPFAVYRPSDFRRAAHPISSRRMQDHVNMLADLMRKGVSLDDVPRLEVGPRVNRVSGKLVPGELEVAGHEGRHRNRAMEQLEMDRSLMALRPLVNENELPLPNPDQHPWPPKTDRRLMWLDKNKERPVYSETSLPNVYPPQPLGPLKNLLIDVFKRGGRA